jgi:hypothetical protein
LLAALLLTSCVSTQENEEEQRLKDYIRAHIPAYKSWVEEGNKVVYIIPVDACRYCVESSIDFINRSDDYEEILFIFSKSKIGKYPIEISGQDYYHIDRENRPYLQRMVNINPKIYFFNEGQLLKTMELKPRTDQQVFDAIYRHTDAE